MQWTKPDFLEITLNMEVTAYVNTDGDILEVAPAQRHGKETASQSSAPQADPCG
jgi:coenzyme PQQ precursor peptide PqqA